MTSRRVEASLFLGIAAAAVFLRGWRLGWALDDELFFPDEILWVSRAARFMPLTWKSFAFEFGEHTTYPTLYGYLVGLAASAAHALGLLRPAPMLGLDMILVARLVAVTAGLANVALVGLLGARLYGRRVGVAAAALMAVLPLEARQVHYASVDALLTACFTLTLLASLALARRGSIRTAVAVGLGAGLAFATKYTGLAALTALATPLVWRRWEDGSWRRPCVLGLVAMGAFLLAVLVACPPCVLSAPTMLGGVRTLQAQVAAGEFPNARILPSLGWYGRPYLYELVAALPHALGWPLHLLAVVGVGVALWRRTLADWLVLGAIVPYFLVVGASPLVFPRYLMPLEPGLAILAARGAAEVRWSRVGLVLLVAVWLYTFAFTTSQVAGISLEQQRAVARWIAERSAPGTRVAFPVAWSGYFAISPFLARAGLVPVPVADGSWLAARAEYFVVPEVLEISIRRDAPTGAAARDLARLESGVEGYRESARWPMRFLQRDLYARLDPGLVSGLGSCGFTVFAREGENRDS